MTGPDTDKKDGLLRRTARGSAWVLAAQVFTRISEILLIMILARLLVPEDFGLVAIAVSLIAILDLVTDVPLASALTRLETITPRHLDTAFSIGLIRAAALYGIIVVAASPIAAFYGDPRLEDILLVIGLAPSLRVLHSPAMAQLYKTLHFRQAFLMQVSGKMLGFFAAVAIAVLTGTFWALIASRVVASVITTILSYWFAPYRPRLTLSEYRYFWGFLGWMFPAQLANAVAWQFDRLFLGSVVPQAMLGFYSMSNNLIGILHQTARRSTSQPLVSSFSAVGGEANRLSRGYQMADTAVLLVGLPVHVVTIFLAGPIVAVLLGPQWTEAVPLLQWLALALIPALLRVPFQSLAMASGHTRYLCYAGLIALGLRVVGVLAGFHWAGIFGVIAAIGVTGVLNALVIMTYTRRLIGITFAAQMRALWPPVVAAAVSGGIAWQCDALVVPVTGALLGLAASCVVVFSAFYGCIYLFWRLKGAPDGIEKKVFNSLRKWLVA